MACYETYVPAFIDLGQSHILKGTFYAMISIPLLVIQKNLFLIYKTQYNNSSFNCFHRGVFPPSLFVQKSNPFFLPLIHH